MDNKLIVFFRTYSLIVCQGLRAIRFDLNNGVLCRTRFNNDIVVDSFVDDYPFNILSPDTGLLSLFEKKVMRYLNDPTNREYGNEIEEHITELNKIL